MKVCLKKQLKGLSDKLTVNTDKTKVIFFRNRKKRSRM